MSNAARVEAMAQFETAYKLGQKYYSNCVQRGVDPHPPVLEDILENKSTGNRSPIGLVDIPLELVVGSTTAGRRTAFAGNFMPLLAEDTEFCTKWINLCAAHLGFTGITDPIICTEYMGRFYVTEGNKRVSVLKSYDATTIPGIVTRVIPSCSDDPEVQVYYEFMDFYKLSQMYTIHFKRVGGFAKLPAALGFAPKHIWTEEERRTVGNAYRRLRTAFDKLNQDDQLALEPGDALLVWLELYTVNDLNTCMDNEIHKRLKALWPDIRLLAGGAAVTVHTEHDDSEKGGILRALGFGKLSRLHIAFIHSFDPSQSAWTASHELGRKHLEEAMGSKLTIQTHVCTVEEADETIDKAIREGAQVIFTTTPPLIDACRKAAAKHPHVRMFNCSLSMPYTGVRTYYSRIYEAKFITGAIAGAMAAEDRIGYIANYPIAGTLAAINAFALGVRMTNPRAKISLKWSCLPGNPVVELLKEGVTIISNRESGAGKSHYAWDWGTYLVEQDGAMMPLASPCWNWGNFYEKVISAIMEGTWDQNAVRGEAVNYWWGMNSGVVDVLLSDKLPTGMRQLAEVLKSGIISGVTEPFHTVIYDREGFLRNNGSSSLSPVELMNMDWLCDNVEGYIPSYDELVPASRSLVRLLGLDRDQLPPETEAKA